VITARSQFEPFSLKVTRMPAAKPNFKKSVAKANAKKSVAKPHDEYEHIAVARFDDFMKVAEETYFVAFPGDLSLGLPFVDMLKIKLPKMKEMLGESMIGDPRRFAAVLRNCISMRLKEEGRLK